MTEDGGGLDAEGLVEGDEADLDGDDARELNVDVGERLLLHGAEEGAEAVVFAQRHARVLEIEGIELIDSRSEKVNKYFKGKGEVKRGVPKDGEAAIERHAHLDVVASLAAKDEGDARLRANRGVVLELGGRREKLIAGEDIADRDGAETLRVIALDALKSDKISEIFKKIERNSMKRKDLPGFLTKGAH